MNIKLKKFLKFGAPVSNGVVIFSLGELKEKIKKLKSEEFVLKAQIHAGGRGKAGIKLKDFSNLEQEAKEMFGKFWSLTKLARGERGEKALY